MARRDETSETQASDRGRVEGDLPCSGCGYNLRTLFRDGDCPECARPIARTIEGDLLCRCQRWWLRRMRVGLLIAMVGLILGMAFATLFLAGNLERRLSWAWSLRAVRWLYTKESRGALSVFCAGTLVLGFGLFTCRDPDKAGRTKDDTKRFRGRVCLAIAGVAAGTMFVAGALRGPFPGFFGWTWLVVTVAAAAGAWNTCEYARELALRVPDRRLARSAARLRWLLVATASLMFFEASHFSAVATWLWITLGQTGLWVDIIVAGIDLLVLVAETLLLIAAMSVICLAWRFRRRIIEAEAATRR